MKNAIHLVFLAALALGYMGCPTTPKEVCFNLPNGERVCMTGQNGTYWIHDDNETIKLSEVNMDPLNWDSYPQFGNVQDLGPGEYKIVDEGTTLTLTGPPSLSNNTNGNNPMSNQIAGGTQTLGSSDQEMGYIVLNRGGQISISSATSTTCDMQELQTTSNGWKLNGNNLGMGITVTSTLLLTNTDGTRLFRREVSSHSSIEQVKGTTVVLIDNFMPDLSAKPLPACCVPGVRDHCPSGLPLPGEEDGDTNLFLPPAYRIPSTGPGEDFRIHRRFLSGVSTITLSCERIHLATCNTTETRCYNTMGCMVELWLDLAPTHLCGAVITDDCIPNTGFSSICGTEIDPNI